MDFPPSAGCVATSMQKTETLVCGRLGCQRAFDSCTDEEKKSTSGANRIVCGYHESKRSTIRKGATYLRFLLNQLLTSSVQMIQSMSKMPVCPTSISKWQPSSEEGVGSTPVRSHNRRQLILNSRSHACSSSWPTWPHNASPATYQWVNTYSDQYVICFSCRIF
jgi:hypothetical protein